MILLAEARRDAEIIKGQGDADAIEILSSVANKDPDFFRFYKSMNAYRSTFSKDSSNFILSSDNPFMHYSNLHNTSKTHNKK